MSKGLLRVKIFYEMLQCDYVLHLSEGFLRVEGVETLQVLG